MHQTLWLLLFWYSAAVLIGRLTRLLILCLSVHPPVPYWLLTLTQRGVEKPKLVLTFPRAEVTGVPVFHSKGESQGLLGTWPHNILALGWHIFLSFTACVVSLFVFSLKVSSLWETHRRATEHHLPYGITQYYLPPTQVNVPHFNPSQAGWYSIYLPWRDGRLSWPWRLVIYRDS